MDMEHFGLPGGIGAGGEVDDIIVIQGNNATLKLEDDSGNYGLVRAGNSQLTLEIDPDGVVASSDIVFKVDGTEAARFNPTGDFGVGISPSEGKVHIKQDDSDYQSGLTLQDPGGGTGRLYHTALNTVCLQKGTNTNQLVLADDGSVGIGAIAPDRMLHIKGDDAGILIERENASPPAFFWSHVDGVDTTHWRMEAIHNGAGAGNGVLNISDDGTVSGGAATIRLTINEVGYVGIGVADPDAELEVNGQVKITGGSPGAGKILTSDAAGLAAWDTVINDQAASGYVDIGDMRLQWGRVASTDDDDQTVTFPVAFGAIPVVVAQSEITTGTAAGWGGATNDVTTTNFKFNRDDTITNATHNPYIAWAAIGTQP